MNGRRRFEIDGEVFEVAARPGHPGVYDYNWTSGPNRQYGFTSARSDRSSSTTAEHEEAIRGFLAEIDPETGYLAD